MNKNIDLEKNIPVRLWQRAFWAFLVCLLPLIFFGQFLLNGLLVIGLLLRYITFTRPILSRIFGVLLIVAGGAVVLSQYSKIGFTFSLVSCLSLLALAKLMESRSIRDIRVLFLLQMLLLLAVLFYSQSPILLVWSLISVLFGLSVLMKVEQTNDQSIKGFSSGKILFKIIVLALPITTMLFIFVPRLPPVWSLPSPERKAVTGLDDQMKMGDIASLAQSNELVFQVKFKGKAPDSSKLYWRGPVLWNFDGVNWTGSERDDLLPPAKIVADDKNQIDYELTLLKDDVQWITPLDIATELPKDLTPKRSFQIPAPRFVARQNPKRRFEIKSAITFSLPEITRSELQDALRLPKDFKAPKMKQLMQQFKEQSGGNAYEFAQLFLNYIRTQNFRYSLEPPKQMGDVEQFFFNGRAGFCEHYANSMAIGARLAGIPSRIVLGYQGGEYHESSGAMLIRQENAHAWVELYDARYGWQRFDPTAAVAPDRINQARLSAQNFAGGEDKRAFSSKLADKIPAFAFVRNLATGAQIWWHNWVVDLDSDKQEGLLQRLNISVSKILLAVLFAGLTFLLLLSGAFKRLKPIFSDNLAKEADRFLKKWQKKGYVYNNQQSLADFLMLIADDQPILRAELTEASELYQKIRYQNQAEHTGRLIAILRKNC